MTQTIRFYGREIGISTPIVDADVAGITSSGDIIFTPTDTSYSDFRLSSERVSELFEDSLAYDTTEIDGDDPIWGAIEDVEAHYEKDTDNLDSYSKASRCLFKGGP
jgi:hypothetical protein